MFPPFWICVIQTLTNGLLKNGSSDEDIRGTQQQLAEVYDTTQQNISQHIDGIDKDGKLMPESTNKNFLWVDSGTSPAS